MIGAVNSPDGYRIEVSGWGLDNKFFVESADLVWTTAGEKRVQLHRALAEGAMVFVRLLAGEYSNSSVPVACQIEEIEPMDCDGRCWMKLAQLHPRWKESPAREFASNSAEDSQRHATCS